MGTPPCFVPFDFSKENIFGILVCFLGLGSPSTLESTLKWEAKFVFKIGPF